jgi:hypothetical protein
MAEDLSYQQGLRLTIWIAKYPRVIGVLMIGFALWPFSGGIESAKVYRQFADALPVAATVASITREPSLLPRWHAHRRRQLNDNQLSDIPGNLFAGLHFLQTQCVAADCRRSALWRGR